LITLPASYKKVIITLYTFKHEYSEYLLSIVYVLEKNDNWNLFSFHIGEFKINNETALDIFNKSKEMYKKNQIKQPKIFHKVNTDRYPFSDDELMISGQIIKTTDACIRCASNEIE